MSKNNFDYQQLINRNKPLFSDELQNKIQKTRILFIGCGLGSQIAITAVRSGFEKFILADGDNVELTNLNRQAFTRKDIGKNKAETLKNHILEINPDADITTVTDFIKTEEEARAVISEADIVINMADPEKIIYSINNLSIAKNIPVLFPLNFVFGSYLIIFTKDSAKLEDMVGGEVTGNDFFYRLVTSSLKNHRFLSSKDQEELVKYMGLYEQVLRSGINIPQTAISTYINSAIIVKNIIKYIGGDLDTLAPKPIIVDPWI